MRRLSADTSLCENRTCPSRAQCLRYLSVPNPRQVYSDFKVPEGKRRCDAFVPAYNEQEKETP